MIHEIPFCYKRLLMQNYREARAKIMYKNFVLLQLIKIHIFLIISDFLLAYYQIATDCGINE